MGLAVKLSLCAVGATVIVGGGLGIKCLLAKEPSVITLEHTLTKPAQGKWWSSYEDKNQLVANDAGNEFGGNWKYMNTFLPWKNEKTNESKLDDQFKKIEKGYSSTSSTPSTALNQACWTAYEKETSDLNNNTNLQNNVKYFCSTEAVKSETKVSQ